MQRVAAQSELPEDRGITVKIGNTEILLVRQGGAVRAYAAKCPHAGGPLAMGAVCDGHIICPWHKARFSAADGALLDPPALSALTRFPVRVEGDDVFADAAPIVTPTPPRGSDARTMLVVGAGAAGIAAALALREFGFAGRVQLLGREPGLPYDRTALSKFVTSGEMPVDEVPALCGEDALADQAIEILHGEVTALHAVTRQAVLADGSKLGYDAALVATGGEPILPDLPGTRLKFVHVLRGRADAAALMEDARGRAVILGSSFIGLEVASGFRKQGIAVDIVAPEQIPFAKQFGPRLGAMFKALHEKHGVVFHSGRKLAAIEGDARAASVRLDTGESLAADLVLIGVGVRPATDFVRGVRKAEDGGIVVDAGMRAADALFAAGDVARFPLDGAETRIEHWRLAQQHGRLAARNMLGGSIVYAGVPFFWTYHYGKRFEYLGHAAQWEETVIDGDPDAQSFVALFVQHGQVVAALGCDRERDMAMLSEAMLAPLGLPEARERLGF